MGVVQSGPQLSGVCDARNFPQASEVYPVYDDAIESRMPLTNSF
jgi:hypothetical protein